MSLNTFHFDFILPGLLQTINEDLADYQKTPILSFYAVLLNERRKEEQDKSYNTFLKASHNAQTSLALKPHGKG